MEEKLKFSAIISLKIYIKIEVEVSSEKLLVLLTDGLHVNFPLWLYAPTMGVGGKTGEGKRKLPRWKKDE